MNLINIKLVQGDFGFEATDQNGHVVKMDTSEETGGQNFGVRPMQMLLMGLGGCSGIDMVSILKKQRQPIAGLNMHIEGERGKGQELSLWEKINIVFELSGNIDEDKALRACALSMDKYCSVAATLKQSGTELTWSLKIVP